jgi:hypothetical protein
MRGQLRAQGNVWVLAYRSISPDQPCGRKTAKLRLGTAIGLTGLDTTMIVKRSDVQGLMRSIGQRNSSRNTSESNGGAYYLLEMG